jgi:hypothetical protein
MPDVIKNRCKYIDTPYGYIVNECRHLKEKPEEKPIAGANQPLKPRNPNSRAAFYPSGSRLC